MAKGTRSNSILEEIQRIENKPGFVYLIRNKDIYKIGITISMKRRMRELKPDEILAVKEAANMKGIEKVLHTRYRHRRIPQSEYFRLSGEEIREATFLLGGTCSTDYTPSETAQRESRSLEVTGKEASGFRLTPRIKSLLATLEDLLVNTLDFNALYKENHDSYTGVTGNIPEIIYNTDNRDPSLKVPVSSDLRQACSRVIVREDVFLPVTQAGSDEEAAKEIERITCDFSLIYLWGTREGIFNITHAEGSSQSNYRQMLREMEKICKRRGVWYTTKPSMDPIWVAIAIALLIAIPLPVLGMLLLVVIILFRETVSGALSRLTTSTPPRQLAPQRKSKS